MNFCLFESSDYRNGIRGSNQCAKKQRTHPFPACKITHPQGSHTPRQAYPNCCQHQDHREFSPQFFPMDLESSFKNERRKEDIEYQFLREGGTFAKKGKKERMSPVRTNPDAIGNSKPAR